MFHTGAQIPGKHPKLQGGGDTSRYMTFQDTKEVDAARQELQAIVQAWCKLKSGKTPRASGKTRPPRKKNAPRKLSRRKSAR
jgi:hypothetical protein